MKKIKILTILSVSLLTGAIGSSLFSRSNMSGASAGPRPTNVNVRDLDGSLVASYYSGANGKSGTALMSFLFDIIKDHVEYDYNSSSDRFVYKIIDRNWTLSPLTPSELSNFNYTNDNPYIRKLYADYNDDPATADLFKNEGEGRVSFDKEHIWAQSLGDFGRKFGAGSDFHHLLPADTKGNQDAHSNNSFGVPVTNISTYTNDKGTYVGRNGNIPGSSAKVFEPLDQYKGDIARAMFYMPVRYFVYQDATHPKLELVDYSPEAVTASSSVTGKAGVLSTLLQWHEEDPVDEYEIHRNNLIYNNYQKNRNPFIDYPQLAKLLYDPSYSGTSANLSPADACTIGSCPYYEPQTEAELISLSIEQEATRKDFFIGESLSTAGLEVLAHFGDGSTSIPASTEISIVGQNDLILNTSGTKTVQIAYTSNSITKTITYQINVASSLNTSLVVTPSKTNFKLKEAYSDSDLTAKVVFTTNNGTFEQAIPFELLTINAPNTSKLGEQSGTVTYKNFTSTFSVFVTNEGVSVGNSAYATDLFFSEYIEGSSNNKAYEIFNGTGQTIDLSNYSVKAYFNGKETPSSTFTFPAGHTIAPNQTKVIYNSNSAVEITSKGDYANNNTANFSGNDVIALYKGDTLIDIIGTIGNTDVFAINVTLVRKSSIYQGNTTFNPNEWDTYLVDTFTYLGTHATSWTSLPADVTALEQAKTYATYFLEVTGPYCEMLNGINIPWAFLKAQYEFMDHESMNLFVSSSDSVIISAKERYLYLVNKYQVFANDNFVTDGDGMLLAIKTKNITRQFSDNVNVFLISILGLSLVSFSAYISYRKKHN